MARGRSTLSRGGEPVSKLVGTRSWPVRAIGALLVLQAAGLAALIFYEVSPVGWSRLRAGMSSETVGTLPVALLFAPPAVLALLAALVFFVFYRRGWLLAMIVQSLTLIVCLALYVRSAPGYVYPVMVYGVLMVLYLNSSEVRVSLRSPDDKPEPQSPGHAP